MMFSSCKKDEKGDEPNPTNPSVSNNYKEKIIVSAPEVIYPKQYQYVGLPEKIDFKWEKPAVKKVLYTYNEDTKSYDETVTDFDYTLKYELCYSKDGNTWDKSDKISETEFTKNITLEEEKTYYYKINTYISYGNTQDSLISSYVHEFEDDIIIPFYSTYEQKHHFGMVKSAMCGSKNGIVVFEWAKGCNCKIYQYWVEKDDKGEYIYKEFPYNPQIYDDGKNSDFYYLNWERMAVKYELTGKYTESGILHLMPIDGSKYIYDGDFNVYEKKQFMNTDKQCAIFPRGKKTQYLEEMFEYAPSGRLKRYNPCTYIGEIVTYENWKEFSKGTSDMQFMIDYQRLLGSTEENTTFPFLKNGEFVCYDKDFDGVDYESRNFDKNCGLIEIMDKYSVDDWQVW